VVRDEWIGRYADDLVKEIKGEEVVGEGATNGAEQREGEAGAEARLGVLLQAAHVAGGVKHGHHPQERRRQGETIESASARSEKLRPGSSWNSVKCRVSPAWTAEMSEYVRPNSVAAATNEQASRRLGLLPSP